MQSWKNPLLFSSVLLSSLFFSLVPLHLLEFGSLGVLDLNPPFFLSIPFTLDSVQIINTSLLSTSLSTVIASHPLLPSSPTSEMYTCHIIIYASHTPGRHLQGM